MNNDHKNIISFSGGKDSTALILWAKENLKNFITVFCDTMWEHAITYAYIDFINKTLLDNKLVVVRPEDLSDPSNETKDYLLYL